MNKVFDKARSSAAKAAKKFTNVSVNRGKTVYPKAPKDLENLGIRWDYDGEVEYDGTADDFAQGWDQFEKAFKGVGVEGGVRQVHHNQHRQAKFGAMNTNDTIA